MITEDLIQEVIKLMACGKSLSQVPACLSVKMSKSKFNRLLTSPKENLDMQTALKEAIELGQTLHEAHFEDLYVKAMMGEIEGCKEGLIKAYMQNKFKWMDKSEVISTANDIENLTDEELNQRRKQLLDKISNER